MTDRTALYEAAFEEGKRAVDDQVDELNSMRTRSVAFLAFVGSATAFLVGAGLKPTAAQAAASGDVVVRGTDFYVVSLVASGMSLLAIVLACFILLALRLRTPVGTSSGRKHLQWPIEWTEWNFRVSGGTLVKKWIDPEVGAASSERFFRDLALQYDAMAAENDGALRWSRALYVAFLLVASTQVVLWSAIVWRYA